MEKYGKIHVHLDPPRGAKWMGKGAIKQPLRVLTPPIGGRWHTITMQSNLEHIQYG